MTNRAARPVLLALTALAVVLVVFAHDVGDTLRAEELTLPEVHAAVVSTISGEEVTLFAEAESVEIAPRHVAVEAMQVANEAETPLRSTSADSGSRLGFGQLAVVVLDSTTGAPLTGVRVRAVDVSRVGDRTSGWGESTPILRLTPRDYALYVSAPGYEPAELASVRVVAGETTTPAPIYLVPGTARILGRVEHLPTAGTVWRVELIGEGRRPCASCEGEPCPHCGFAAGETRVAVAADGSFAFDRLASAIYLLRIVDANERECSKPLRIDLHVAESHYTVLAPAPPRTMRIALEDADGASLADAWAARMSPVDGSGFDARERRLAESELTWDCTFRADGALVGRGSFVSPAPEGVGIFNSRTIACGGCGGCYGRGRDDRLRAPAEELRPVRVEPAFAVVHFALVVDARGHVLAEAVPARVDRIELVSGQFAAQIRIGADPENVQRARITVEGGGRPATFRAYEEFLVDWRRKSCF